MMTNAWTIEEKLLPVVKRVFSKIASVTASSKSALGRAKNYALGQEKNILNIFKGYFELSNNSAERAVKESVMGKMAVFINFWRRKG